MEENKQQEQQEVEQPAAEETKAEVKEEQPAQEETSQPQAESAPQETESPVQEEVEAVDEKGVPYKNRAAMYQRQLEKLQQEVDYIKAQQVAPQTQAQPKPENTPDPKADLDTFVQLGPTAYYQKKRAEEQYQAQVQQAEQLIFEQAGKDVIAAKMLIPKVLETAKNEVIDLKNNPVAGVKAVFKTWEMQKKIAEKAQKAEKKVVEKQRVEKINKTKTEGGNKPPAPPVDKSSDTLNNLRQRGSDDDVINHLKEIL